ncbi:hypothetical protein [Sedimentimonas flavescens]|uniref:hypothetical protein n=1 Tax=Sedimentimonas flavescens TaxID=2851012 RepID=UPI0021A27F54|nr:hypothetical protein [Sedimentimonas flavescens]MCT2538769.1 hypothetical protein [Sedimentimonas flavescens]
MQHDDDLRAIVSALPPELKLDGAKFEEVLRKFAERRPGYFTQPISNAECAALLGKTPNALAMMRQRGEGPPGFTKIAGGYVYQSRLHVLRWVNDQIARAALEPSKRGAA